jgi:hypothetical protein
MKPFLIALCLLLGFTAAAERRVWQPAGHKQPLLWPETPPGAMAGQDWAAWGQPEQPRGEI